jgi:hypothetical protein
MAGEVPIIFTPPAPAPNIPLPGRLLCTVLAGACLAVLLVGARLTPNGAGESTHMQLGFIPCQFLERTGLPCPTCGMTTSFSWFARGNLLASLWVQPFGLALAGIVAITFWLALYMAISAKPAWRLLAMLPTRLWLGPLMALAVIGWAWKIFIHLRGIDGWN